ncbi:hypothetical protein [Jiangella gansuensis]|uniref:hypothetical protein n=1 Tax=Jiangella gansuensis TaxID=281473 RepID=UPI00047A30CC|nr:hypothetical protein [Jiangella gansuensis]
MSLIAESVTILANACDAAGGGGLGGQVIDPPDGNDCKVSAFHVQLGLAGGITDPFHLIFKVLMTITWAIYQFQVIALAWVTDFVLGMTWLDWFSDFASTAQDWVAGLLHNLNAYVTILMITALVCVIWMARGMWGKGIVQLLISIIVANYALAAISYDSQHPENNLIPFSPVTWLVGGNEQGLLYDARDTANSLVDSLTADLNEVPETPEQPDSPGQGILETFLYQPAMLINFGRTLSGQCEQAYVIALSHAGNGTSKDDLKDALGDRAGQGTAAEGVDTGSELTDPGTWWGGTGDEPVNYDPEVWKVVGKCETDDVDAFAKMARPDSWMAQLAIQPAVTILAILIMIVACVVFIAGISALVQCVKLLVTLMLAILPGGARSALWRNIGQLFATVLMLMFAIVFLGVFLNALTYLMATGDAGDGGSAMWSQIGKFLLVDLLLIAGIVLFWRGRGAVNSTKDRMAAAMSSRFGAGAGAGGGGGGGGFGGNSLVPSGGGGAISRMAGNFNRASDVARNMGATGSQGGRLQGVLRRTTRLAGHVGMAWATGGGSVAAKGGAMAAKSYAGRKTRDFVANQAGRSVEFARRVRVQHHLKQGNHAAVNRINTHRRRAEMSRAHRTDQARLRKFDRDTRRAERVSRVTGGRFGAERVNQAPTERRQLIREMRAERRHLDRDHRAKSREEKSRLTPDERAVSDARDQRLKQQDRWRRLREDQLNARREVRRRRKDGT